MFRGDNNKKDPVSRRYATGFKWGRREHNANNRTTKMLALGIGALLLHLGTDWIPLEYAALALFVLAFILRVFANYSHQREKHYMDSMRFGKKQD